MRRLKPFSNHGIKSSNLEVPVSCTWDASGTMLIGSSKSHLYAVHANTGKTTAFAQGHRGPAPVVAAHPTQPYFVTIGSFDKQVFLWDSRSAWKVAQTSLPEAAVSATFHPSGELVAVGLKNGFLAIIRIMWRPVNMAIICMIDVSQDKYSTSTSDVESAGETRMLTINEYRNKELRDNNNVGANNGHYMMMKAQSAAAVTAGNGGADAAGGMTSREVRVGARRAAAIAAAKAHRDGRVEQGPAAEALVERRKAYEMQRGSRSQAAKLGGRGRRAPNPGLTRGADRIAGNARTQNSDWKRRKAVLDRCYGHPEAVTTHMEPSKSKAEEDMEIARGLRKGNASTALKDVAFSPNARFVACAEHKFLYVYRCTHALEIDRGIGGADVAADRTDSMKMAEELGITWVDGHFDDGGLGDPETDTNDQIIYKNICFGTGHKYPIQHIDWTVDGRFVSKPCTGYFAR